MGASAVPAGEIRHIVIIGAGHGGGSSAAVLRQQGFEGGVSIFGPEPTVSGRWPRTGGRPRTGFCHATALSRTPRRAPSTRGPSGRTKSSDRRPALWPGLAGPRREMISTTKGNNGQC